MERLTTMPRFLEWWGGGGGGGERVGERRWREERKERESGREGGEGGEGISEGGRSRMKRGGRKEQWTEMRGGQVLKEIQ